MSIISIISKNCKQTAVYWSSPVNDGYGGFTFAEPIEIKCRWEDKVQFIRMDDGNMQASRAIVYVLQELDEEGYLYLGTLADLDSADEDDPTIVSGAYNIKKFEKSPVLGKTNAFAYKAWLTPLLT